MTHGWNEFLAHAGIPTRPNSLDSVYLIHIYPYLAYLHITNNNNCKYQSNQILLQPVTKKRLRPSDRQVGDGASSGSRSRSQSRMGQLLIPDWLPAVTNPLLSHSERGVWRIISRVSSLRDVCIYIRIYVCLFLWWCSYAHLVRDLFRVYFMYLHVPQGLVFVAPSPNLAGFYLTSFFDFWSVLTFQMSFGRFDVSFLLEFRDVSVAKLKN